VRPLFLYTKAAGSLASFRALVRPSPPIDRSACPFPTTHPVRERDRDLLLVCALPFAFSWPTLELAGSMHFSLSVPAWVKSWNDARLAVVSLVVLQVGFGVLHRDTRGKDLYVACLR
jgi:hypothetical protein